MCKHYRTVVRISKLYSEFNWNGSILNKKDYYPYNINKQIYTNKFNNNCYYYQLCIDINLNIVIHV
jgi:hypothetical protein